MKKVLFVIASFIIVASVHAQSSYKNAIGGRIGSTYYDFISGSFKTFITTPGALEFNVGFGARSYVYDKAFSVSASASYQHHFPIANIEGFKWYVGGGLTVYNAISDYKDYKGTGFGVFPTGGVDYKIRKIPLDVSADIRPTIFITGPGYYNSVSPNFGVAARYTF